MSALHNFHPTLNQNLIIDNHKLIIQLDFELDLFLIFEILSV
jgi:hypothetical protein